MKQITYILALVAFVGVCVDSFAPLVTKSVGPGLSPPAAQTTQVYDGPRTGVSLFASSSPEPSSSQLSSTSESTAEGITEISEPNDPIYYTMSHLQTLDKVGILNTGLLVVIALAVLTKFTMIDVDLMRGWYPEEMALRTVSDNWQSYSAILEQAPIQTKAVTSATVYTIGDLIAQRTEGNTMGELDRGRVLRSLLAGLIGHGPLSHFWYQYSEVLFNDVLHWTQWWSFFPKVLVDQTTWGPFWNNTYILLLGIMKFESPQTMWGDMKRTTIPLIVSGLKLWPLAHCITYGVIPVENRLLWVDLVEILWVTILATQAAGAPEDESTDNTATAPAS